LSLDECKEIYRKLKAHDCLVGQPVGWNDGSAAALRICISARHVTEAWTPDSVVATQNLKDALDRVALIATRIESMLGGQNIGSGGLFENNAEIQ